MKKILSLLLALLVLTGCAADTNTPGTTGPEQESQTTTTTTAAPDPNAPQASDFFTYFSLSLGTDYEHIRSLTAYPNEDGSLHVEYVGEIKKVGDMDASAAKTIMEAFADSGLKELHGQDVYEEGEANGSMYITLNDTDYLGASFSGSVPQAYTYGYAVMDICFMELTKDLAEYVPQPVVNEGISQEDLAVINGIIAHMKLDTPDAYMISPVPKDEYMAFTLGVSEDAPVVRGISFSAMMMTTPYSLNIAVLEEGADVSAVCEDFKTCLDWGKWVCVIPESAMIATKDGMVLCLMGSGILFSDSVAAIAADGWTEVESLKNPAL